ncbi:hypothetical protein [Actinoplanes sp. NPDC089786]|uniref:hypothetical protein n=1 Tax=Actinoplanes sp. NPDC089786 TaxID=3155185 RepID=UPI00344692CA
MPHSAELHAVARARRRHSPALLAHPNVIGTAAGPQLTGGRPTGDLAVKVYVERKVPGLVAPAAVPRLVDGVPTDVIETGPARALPAGGEEQGDGQGSEEGGRQSGERGGGKDVLGGGDRVGFPGDEGGTIATVCFDARPERIGRTGRTGPTEGKGRIGRPLLLSNHHVLVMAPGTRLRNRLVRPPSPDDVVGRLARAAPLRPDGPNRVDAALARLAPDVEVETPEFGPVSEATLAQRVRKNGSSTGITEGRVQDLDADIVVEVRGRPIRFTGQLVLDLAARPGDSGSLVVTPDRAPVGLLFAGTDAFVLANPIGAVLAALRIRLP